MPGLLPVGAGGLRERALGCMSYCCVICIFLTVKSYLPHYLTTGLDLNKFLSALQSLFIGSET